MSYAEQPGGSYPPRDPRDPRDNPEYLPRDNRESEYPPPPTTSEYPPPPQTEYPPPPGEEDSRPRAYHARQPSSSSITLPSMSQTMPAYDQQYGPPNGYGPPQYQYPPQGYGPPPGAYAQDPYGRGAPPNMQFQQSAPRQRTAIACRYCRRRKIRCSGFDQSPDGRCANCQRFQQECIFTPVSSQTQAFVPAHAVYPHIRNMVGPDGRPMMYPPGQQLYGAHGQPLGTVQPQHQQQHHQQQQQPPPPRASPYGEYNPAAPSPTGSYNSFTDERGESSRKRPQAEPQTALLPPPVPGQPFQGADGRRPPATGEDSYRLPPVTPQPTTGPASNYSPASASASNASPAPQARTPPQKASPPSDGRTDPMSLGNIMDNKGPSDGPDRDMLRRLDRKGPPST